MKIKHPSLELGWLPKPKQMSLPHMVFEEEENCSGKYYLPFDGQVLINGKYYDCDNGLISVGPDKDIASTIAHEFRHHQQLMSGIDLGGTSFENTSGTYKDRIVEYFSKSITELDALIFEVNHYPDKTNQEWLHWIIKSYV